MKNSILSFRTSKYEKNNQQQQIKTLLEAAECENMFSQWFYIRPVKALGWSEIRAHTDITHAIRRFQIF